MSRKLLFTVLLLLSGLTQAELQKAIAFYRSPRSPFASGELSLAELQKNLVPRSQDDSYLVKKESKDAGRIWVDSDKILRDIDLTQMSLVQGRPQSLDLGRARNIIPAQLRKTNSWTSETILTLAALTPLDYLESSGNWAKVRYYETSRKGQKEFVGYVEMNNLILRADFAAFASTENKKLRPVKYRELDELVLDRDEHIKLDSVRTLISRPERGIVVRKDEAAGLNIRTQVEIEKAAAGVWRISNVRGHGEVYWQLPNDDSAKIPVGIKTEELLKREITSVAFHPDLPSLGIVAAHDIYLTRDGGANWRKLDVQGSGPVAVGPSGELVVGDSMSVDGGLHFSRFIHWDELANLIELNRGRSVPQLHLRQVSFLSYDQLELVLDTGVQKLRVAGRPFHSSSWHWTE